MKRLLGEDRGCARDDKEKGVLNLYSPTEMNHRIHP
jgi:hypothetical protein